jgi:site-specific DNA recombinase
VDIASVRKAADELIEVLDSPNRLKLLAALVDDGQLRPGQISIALDRDALAMHLHLAPDRIDPASLALTSAFTLRRRGVEAKLVLDNAAPEIDRTLLTNIARGWSWFNEIKQGTSMQEIARRVDVSQRRIAQLVDLAFLAPEIVEAITAGRQPVSLTSDALIKSEHRSLWIEQQAMIGAL